MPRIVVALLPILFFTWNAAGQSGWTDFVADLQHNQKIVYVSKVHGGDPGTTYYWDSGNPPAAIGPNPFEPAGSVDAFETIQAAYAALDTGQPGWILLRRGESWDEQWNSDESRSPDLKSGPSSGPGWMLIGAWADDTSESDRPSVERIRMSQDSEPLHSIALVGIEVRGEDGTAIHLDRPGGKWHFEDVLVPPGRNSGIIIQNTLTNNPPLEHLVIRRSIVHGRYPTVSPSSTGHVQGLRIDHVEGGEILIEECIFWHNGWRADYDPETCDDPGGGNYCPTINNQNVYIDCGNVSDITFVRNITADASSHGCQQRPGGLNGNNLYLRNPIGLLWGPSGGDCPWDDFFAYGDVRDNVIIDGRDIWEGALRGWGIEMQKVGKVTEPSGQFPTVVEQNLIAHQRTGQSGHAFRLYSALVDILIENNVVYDWSHANGCVDGMSTFCHSNPQVNVTIRNNHFQQVSNGEIIHHSPGFAEFTFQGNSYFVTPANEDCAFRIPVNPCDPVGCSSGSATCHDFASWVSESGETGASFGQVSYLDPYRDIESYLTCIGGYCLCPDCNNCSVCNGHDPEMILCGDAITAFMLLAIQQSKTNWDPFLTAEAVNGYMRRGFNMETCP